MTQHPRGIWNHRPAPPEPHRDPRIIVLRYVKAIEAHFRRQQQEAPRA